MIAGSAGKLKKDDSNGMVKAWLVGEDGLPDKRKEYDIKFGYRLTTNFSTSPVELRRIYFLADSSEPAITPIHGQERMLELVRHTYPTRFLHSGGSDHFQNCARLAREIGFYRLNRPRDLSRLDEVARLVEEHLERQN